MNKESALINERVGKMIEIALDKYPKTRQDVADMLKVSTKQLRNYANGIFPKYKGKKIAELDKLLKTNAYVILYPPEQNTEQIVPRENTEPSYLEQRRWGKIIGEEYFAPLIPYKARAGYSKNYENVDYVNQEFETYQMPPGIKYRGSEWRWFEVGGDSMLPILSNGDYLLCSLVPEADWLDIEEYLIYVIVWNTEISVKRLAIDKGDFILISENEELEGQKRVAVSNVKEIWKLRRQLNARFPPTKKFKIKV